MVTYLRLQLRDDELLVVDLSHAVQLWCEEGELWLTHEHSTEDVVLSRGEHRELVQGKVLIEGRARLCLCGENLQISPQSRSRGAALAVA